jgi:ATP-dependent Clp protease ATP-binding subunit ClpB
MKIIDIQLAKLNLRMKDKDITLHVRESARQYLLENGYNPSFGARPLKRAIQKHLENPLAIKMLDGEFDSKDHIIVEGSSGGLKFTRQLTS